MNLSSTTKGLIGAFGIWFTAGAALPFVNVLIEFSPEQLMFFRGVVTALLMFVLAKGNVFKVDKYTYLLGIAIPLTTLGVYEGVRAWGAGPTIIFMTAAPLVNFALSPFFNRKISKASVVSLLLLILGVVLARWGGVFNVSGLLWSILAAVMSGAIYEFFSRSKDPTNKKGFWAFLGMAVLGLIASIFVGVSWEQVFDVKLGLTVIAFALVGGYLYWASHVWAFDNLKVTEASVLAQGETPAVIIGAYLLLGETLTLVQWIGVFIALYGAYRLSRWISRESTGVDLPPPNQEPAL